MSAKPNYDIIREQFLLVIPEFTSCQSIISCAKTIKDKNSFSRFFERYIEQIAEYFGLEVEDVEDMEEQISDLETDVSNLEDEVDNLKHKYGPIITYWDELKIKHFLSYKDKYTEEQLENLLKNGIK